MRQRKKWHKKSWMPEIRQAVKREIHIELSCQTNSPKRKHRMANHHSHGSSNNSSNISGVGAFIPREVLDPKPSREERQRVLESKQDTLETK